MHGPQKLEDGLPHEDFHTLVSFEMGNIRLIEKRVAKRTDIGTIMFFGVMQERMRAKTDRVGRRRILGGIGVKNARCGRCGGRISRRRDNATFLTRLERQNDPV